MNKLIIISEAQSKLLEQVVLEEDEEITYGYFQDAIKSFLKELLTNPMHPEVPQFFKDKGFTKNSLLDKIVKLGIARESNKVVEVKPNGDDSNGQSHMKISYSIPKKDFRSHVTKFYNELCKQHINEEGEGAAVGGEGGASFLAGDAGDTMDSSETAKSAQGSGQYVAPFGWNTKKGKKKGSDVMRRTFNI